MGMKSVRKSPKGGASDEMKTKYDKFAELQRRRKALESTSDENLTSGLQQSSIEDSLRRLVCAFGCMVSTDTLQQRTD